MHLFHSTIPFYLQNSPEIEARKITVLNLQLRKLGPGEWNIKGLKCLQAKQSY